jgi:light-harvesting protein B-800-850 alpha chain
MNQGRIWCVVSPNHGLPLFLGSVALMSFVVHYAVLSNSTWYKDFYNGVAMKSASVEKDVTPVAKLTPTVKPALAVDVAQAEAVSTDKTTVFVVKEKPKTLLKAPAIPGPG